MLTNRQKSMAEYIRGTRATAPPEVADQHPELYDPWVVGEAVSVGDRRAYNELLYEAIQSHTTQADWTPDVTPSLWKRAYTEEWPEWVQPTGAQDAYKIGDKVTHNGKKYVSNINANTTEPGTDDRWWMEYVE